MHVLKSYMSNQVKIRISILWAEIKVSLNLPSMGQHIWLLLEFSVCFPFILGENEMQKHLINPLLSYRKSAQPTPLILPLLCFLLTNRGPAWATGINTAKWH